MYLEDIVLDSRNAGGEEEKGDDSGSAVEGSSGATASPSLVRALKASNRAARCEFCDPIPSPDPITLAKTIVPIPTQDSKC